MYSSEQELVTAFISQLLQDNPWNTSSYETEFNYQRGKTDIIAISSENEVVAIEAKLEKWRIALQQAYRNRCYANMSYVLLPLNVAQLAQKHSNEFERRGVGICSIINDHIVVLKDATFDQPVQPWLRDIALQYALEGT